MNPVPIWRAATGLAAVLFCSSALGQVAPPGPAPVIDAIEAAPGVNEFYVPSAEPELLRPSHPPIDQIPPMPMPDDRRENRAVDPSGGQPIVHDPETGETTSAPIRMLSPLDDALRTGGYYAGADGGEGLGDEELPASMFANMSQITNVADHPFRMNAKLVMRYGSDWFVCSGTMRDAETVLTAGHCVYDYGGAGWADEIWVYPGYDGTGWSLPPDDSVGSYGYGHGTYFASWTGWTGSGDWNYDVGLVRVTRAVGMLTGWYGWAAGGDCSWHLGQTYHNASYPSEDCGGGLHNGLDMYYWYGRFDSCPSWNRLQIDTLGGCFNAVWGGMSGSGAYYIDGDSRFVHGVCSTSDRSTQGRYARQWQDWVDYTNTTFIPDTRGAAFDMQALDVNAEPSIIQAGNSTSVLNHLAANPTNGTASGTWHFDVYLSTNDNISTSDTLLSSQYYSRDFAAMGSVRVNTAQVTIPANTPPGNYWIGVVYDPGTDGVSANNDSDGWDAVPITVTAAPRYTLNVYKSGSGVGTVASSPSGINCGSDCTHEFTGGTTVTLTASAAAGSRFAGWSGACSGSSSTCNLAMTSAKSVTAQFEPLIVIYHSLQVGKAGTGNGIVTSSPAGINCGTDCTHDYSSGTTVTLTADPAAGSTFGGWGGACSGTGLTCNLTMSSSKFVSATFSGPGGLDAWLAPETHTVGMNSPFDLAVYADGDGGRIGSFDFELGFDASMLQVDTAQCNNGVCTGTDGFTPAVVVVNNATGEIRVNGFDVTGAGPGDALEMLVLKFVSQANEGTTPVSLNTITLTDELANSLGTNSQGATVEITALLCGDANMDGAVSIADALVIARGVAGVAPPPPIDTAAADVNGDGSMTIADALLIARFVAGLTVTGTCLF
jgi:hypothetical protein